MWTGIRTFDFTSHCMFPFGMLHANTVCKKWGQSHSFADKLQAVQKALWSWNKAQSCCPVAQDKPSCWWGYEKDTEMSYKHLHEKKNPGAKELFELLGNGIVGTTGRWIKCNKIKWKKACLKWQSQISLCWCGLIDVGCEHSISGYPCWDTLQGTYLEFRRGNPQQIKGPIINKYLIRCSSSLDFRPCEYLFWLSIAAGCPRARRGALSLRGRGQALPKAGLMKSCHGALQSAELHRVTCPKSSSASSASEARSRRTPEHLASILARPLTLLWWNTSTSSHFWDSARSARAHIGWPEICIICHTILFPWPPPRDAWPRDALQLPGVSDGPHLTPAAGWNRWEHK